MADTKTGASKFGPQPKKYLCGTPDHNCIGSVTRLSHGMKNLKTHESPQAAFKCHAKYLVDVLKFTQIGSREFDPGDGGPIRVLTKKSKFGAMLRGGKEGRHMPKSRLGGTIISS